MTPNRVRRLLVFVGVCTGAVLLTQSSEPTGAAPRHASPWIESDSVRITNAFFSPNGDGRQDVVSFALSLAGSTTVFVHVLPQGVADTVATIVEDSVPDPRVTFNFAWDGRGDDSQLQPEGNYSVLIRGLVPPDSTGPVLPDSTVFLIQRQVRLDVTAPRVEILEVDPAEYAPNTEHVGVVPEIHLRVSQSQLEDSVRVVIDDSLRLKQTLALAGGFSGDGDYSAPCHDCALPTFLDGPLYITATAHDVAGNRDSSFAILDKNVAPPEFEIERPNTRDPNEDPAGRFHFQMADSLVGLARDRQVVDSVTVAFLPDSTAFYVPPRDSLLGTEYRFFQDLSQTLTEEGAHELLIGARDVAGVAATHKLTIVIDRTADAPPTIIPRPPTVTKLQVLQFTIAADDSAIRRVIIKGGVGPPDTLGMSAPQRAWQRTLNPGPNLMSFESMDYARNISVADTMTVVWETSEGLVAPERFLAGQSIQVDVGESPAERVSVRILALDGSLVRTFEDSASRLVYTFQWNLNTPEGRPVRNGGYLIWAQVRYPNGTERTFRRMTAVVR